MTSAQEIFEYYTTRIKRADSVEERKNAQDVWNEVYDNLSETYKTEIKAMLKQKAKTLLSSQAELDKRITAAGLPSLEDFYRASVLM
ncbi:MAG: hypothetical protein MUE30_06320 [Spirosomaceae bacterium]|nr:hypothetical protein [Spirosomataceae bacterium]